MRFEPKAFILKQSLSYAYENPKVVLVCCLIQQG
jgi:hypothetical protein